LHGTQRKGTSAESVPAVPAAFVLRVAAVAVAAPAATAVPPSISVPPAAPAAVLATAVPLDVEMLPATAPDQLSPAMLSPTTTGGTDSPDASQRTAPALPLAEGDQSAPATKSAKGGFARRGTEEPTLPLRPRRSARAACGQVAAAPNGVLVPAAMGC